MTARKSTSRSRKSTTEKPEDNQVQDKEQTGEVSKESVTDAPEVKTDEAPKESGTEKPEDNQGQSDQLVPEPEVEASTVDRFAKVDVTDMTDAGKAFYQESDENASTRDVIVMVSGSNELPIGIYTAAAINATYFKELPNGNLIANRLSDFITKTFGLTNEDRDYALNMFQLMIRSTENLDDATFTKTYQKLTEFVGNDIRAGGFFSDVNAIAALRGSPEASSFFMLLKRLVPSKDRKAVAAKTNYAQACGLFKKEKSRELMASLFK